MSGNLAVHIFLIVSGFCVVLSVVNKIQYDMKGLQTIVFWCIRGGCFGFFIILNSAAL